MIACATSSKRTFPPMLYAQWHGKGAMELLSRGCSILSRNESYQRELRSKTNVAIGILTPEHAVYRLRRANIDCCNVQGHVPLPSPCVNRRHKYDGLLYWCEILLIQRVNVSRNRHFLWQNFAISVSICLRFVFGFHYALVLDSLLARSNSQTIVSARL